ncbi:MAG TPA: hypothetical protein VK013_01745 [Myxococcaceae bacterium]|nr:hypothetical protein [Myxococcaceae bacterium]
MGTTTESLLAERPERVAAAWRRTLSGFAEHPHMLEGAIEPFLRELAGHLRGEPGSPWSRTRGVLRLSARGGQPALDAEFASLERCLLTTISVLGSPGGARARLREALVEAHTSASAYLARLFDPLAPPPRVPFGGLVIERIESAPRPAEETSRLLH